MTRTPRILLIGCGGAIAVVLFAAVVLVGSYRSVFNRLVALDEGVQAGWSQVENVYQRRADLVPNLVATVEGAADFERETLDAVIRARARATSVQLNPGSLDAQALGRFEAAQGALSGALSRLMVVVERYPDLKANQNFLSLQDELAGTENRIAVERRRFNEAAQAYNTERRGFFVRLVADWSGFEEAAYFEAEAGAETAPEVDFSR